MHATSYPTLFKRNKNRTQINFIFDPGTIYFFFLSAFWQANTNAVFPRKSFAFKSMPDLNGQGEAVMECISIRL